MRKWIFFFIIVLLGIVQLTVLDYFKIFNIKPDLLLICVVIASLIFELKPAMVLSVFAGIFKDAFGVVSTLPINTLLFALWSFLIVRLSKNISLDNNLMRLFLVFIVTILHNTITGLIFIYSGKLVPLGIFLRIVSIEAIYTALILPLVFRIIKQR